MLVDEPSPSSPGQRSPEPSSVDGSDATIALWFGLGAVFIPVLLFTLAYWLPGVFGPLVLISVPMAIVSGLLAVLVGVAARRGTTTGADGRPAAFSGLMKGAGMPEPGRLSAAEKAIQNRRFEATAGIALGVMGMTIWIVAGFVFLVAVSVGGPD